MGRSWKISASEKYASLGIFIPADVGIQVSLSSSPTTLVLRLPTGLPASAENLKYTICPVRGFDDVELALLSVYRRVHNMLYPLQNR
jgi:hypothetical protein